MSGPVGGRYAELVVRLRTAVLERDGATEPALRQAIEARAAAIGGRPGPVPATTGADGPGSPPARGRAGDAAEAPRATASPKPDLPPEVAAFVDKAARFAADVTDEDIAALRRAGYPEDAVFEIIAAVAVGAGASRVERGMAALERAV